MHATAFEFVRRTAWSLPPLARVCEFGSRQVNGSVREIFTAATCYMGIDLEPGPGVDVVADAASWGEPDAWDAVVCCEVFEHSPWAADLCFNAARLLRPGGVFIVTAAALGRPEHSAGGGPLREGEFYRAVTVPLLWDWLGPFGFALVDGFSVPGDVYALGVRIP